MTGATQRPLVGHAAREHAVAWGHIRRDFLAIRTSFGNVAGYSGATTQGLVDDKETRDTGATPIHAKTDSSHEVSGTEPQDTVVVNISADPHVLGHATSKLNDPPVRTGLKDCLPPGAVGTLGGLVLGGVTAGVILSATPLSVANAVVFTVLASGGTAVCGCFVELGAGYLRQPNA